ncbi:uncharacterized protein PHACADRAFT_258637 [Phanerochaete carnosa HHB-10118-sp]|uniref:Chloride channel protein n=1 Tax=Phanerochaete carnosa (strain HHB-10118-sp) TaxID=650164 RepID=K5UX28_PHACS|nr:uncharacterized protein PHACADRAFT_258637 [Phanerochaete carnosa HHB-10118-sp]EKM54646.1 hypothetical protein PHACADRAFT_258637 [Phanerochaete carnosa HHB-10118-sp]
MTSAGGPSLKRRRSNTSPVHEEVPSGPLSGPSTIRWRQQRLLSIRRERAQDGEGESATLSVDSPRNNYGTMPAIPRRNKSKLNLRHGLSSLQGLVIPKAISNPASSAESSPTSFVEHLSYLRERPISAYDRSNYAGTPEAGSTESDVKTNGIRVWYSSFTSIDWLHDVIKDSARQARLRRRTSLRSKAQRSVDRTVGWFVVSIIGFLTAVIAFLITRSEQWLFDFKEGYCRPAWFKSKRFCCPITDDVTLSFTPASAFSGAEGDGCSNWRTWYSILGPVVDGNPWLSFESEMVEYIAYVAVALTWAIISCLLTIYLTASTSFVTRKDSSILAPPIAPVEDAKAVEPALVDPKRKVLYFAAGSGIPEIKTILSGFVIHGYLGGRTLFTKSVGLALSVASGLSLGKEGPFVHIASCVGNIVSRFFEKYESNEAKRREVLSAACAAGVAVAFGAPIGGVLFSLEEVSYFFPAEVMWRSFFCAMVAAMTLKFLDPFGSGKLVLFQVTYDKDWHAYELIPFLFLSVFGGVWGAWFSKLNIRWAKHVRNGTWLKWHPVFEVVLVTLATSLLCFVNPYTRMSGTELVYNLFAECKTGSPNTHQGLCVLNPPEQALPLITAIGVAMVIKGALTIVTFGIKLPAGIFIPSLGVGACAGRIVGILVQWAHFRYPGSPIFAACNGNLNCVVPGLYAMVGAAASLSGVTRTTVSLAVIMFELTDTLTYVVPVMLAVLVAKSVADALEPKGIYDLVIELANLPYLDPKREYSWAGHQISDVTDRDAAIIRVNQENNVKSLCGKLQTLVLSGRHDSGFPIVRKDDSGSRMVGYIGVNELEHALSIVADHPNRVIVFHSTTSYEHPGTMASSFSSTAGDTSPMLGSADPFDLSYYMDQAPLTVQSNSPLELVQQLFTKLGARYIVVTDTNGYYEGVIDKKVWLAFLEEVEQT